ncbi:Ser-Asp rich fibrinogen-binding, bone sialoprotein-binding protein [Natrialba hulunbeirensis JCM 10989]|uniref:Ser-Asp rich fibrinogen-binding, bone sialoprotein-binding protein n=1 Tax=Natrialba hulunbeirensis JCM 10989 TaxID=1227493 RepID=M0A715_9EURY|nr:hypothetical protein [Natrialba hulunbeirensis]ELY94151.1 Ser-Asp rich fibrinogen-binding, bone sialoprotein-binding protein [Natrialba hulunbeirensis JCM 10989]
MNRRTALRSAGVLATVGLAGCVDAVEEHFQGRFQGIIPIEIHSEAERSHNIAIEAYDQQAGRQTYDESYTVTPDQRVSPPHLEATTQSVRFVRYDGTDEEQADVREVSVTSNTMLVSVRIHDDDLVIEVQRGDTDGEPTENETIDNETAGELEDESELPDNQTESESDSDSDSDSNSDSDSSADS